MCVNVRADTTTEDKGLDVYYVRHAETVGNKTGDYSGQNQHIFTAEGEDMRDAVVHKLAPYHFDHIIVSPAYRTRHTILPYLAATSQVAEVWPELNECYWERGSKITDPNNMHRGAEIILEEEHVPYFTFRDNGHHYIKCHNASDGAALVKSAANFLLKQYGQSGESVLVVGHYFAGRGLLETLLGDNNNSAAILLANATVTHLQQSPNGVFKLLMLNDIPQKRAVVVSQ